MFSPELVLGEDEPLDEIDVEPVRGVHRGDGAAVALDLIGRESLLQHLGLLLELLVLLVEETGHCCMISWRPTSSSPSSLNSSWISCSMAEISSSFSLRLAPGPRGSSLNSSASMRQVSIGPMCT